MAAVSYLAILIIPKILILQIHLSTFRILGEHSTIKVSGYVQIEK